MMRYPAVALVVITLNTACDIVTEPAPEVHPDSPDPSFLTMPESCGNCVVGPLTLTRAAGEPSTHTFTFAADPAAGYVLDVWDNGSRGLTGSVRLNGLALVSQADLGGNAPFGLHRAVNVLANNTLEIRLEGKPGATMMLALRSGVQTIGSGGGLLRSPGGDLTVEVPAGALAGPTELSIAPLVIPGATDLEAVWELGPNGTAFAKPVAFNVRVDPARLAAAGPGAMPLVVTADRPGDPEWTIVPEPSYDPVTSILTVSLSHFSPYAITFFVPEVGCSRYFWNSPSVTRLSCLPFGAIGQYTDTLDVTAGGSRRFGLLVEVTRIISRPQIIGVMAACENLIIGWPYCVDVRTTSSNPAVAVRDATGLVTGVAEGTAVLTAAYQGFVRGRALVRVGPAPTTLFSLATRPDSELGGVKGNLIGGATLAGGRLLLNGTGAYVRLGSRVIPASGSFSVALFAREFASTPTYVEFISQGVSPSGFYIGHTPGGFMRISDAFQVTSVPMPQDNLEHHYAVTYDAATNISRGYLDGQLVASAPGSPARGTAGGNDTRLGRQFDPFAEFLNGTIDDVAVYPSALSATDIQAVARRTADLPCSAEGSARSINGAVSSTIVLENQTGEPVRVDWLDYSGTRQFYAFVNNGNAYSQGTFLTHPWIVTGLTTGACYGIWLPVSTGRIVRIG